MSIDINRTQQRLSSRSRWLFALAMVLGTYVVLLLFIFPPIGRNGANQVVIRDITTVWLALSLVSVALARPTRKHLILVLILASIWAIGARVWGYRSATTLTDPSLGPIYSGPWFLVVYNWHETHSPEAWTVAHSLAMWLVIFGLLSWPLERLWRWLHRIVRGVLRQPS